MQIFQRRILFLIVLLLCCTAIVLAQDEEIAEYMTPFNVLPQIIQTIVWSALYLPFYAAALVLTLSYLRLFTGFDNDVYLWIAVLWAGGLAINAIAYAFTKNQVLASMIAMPLLFGWSVLINTRSFADLTLDDARRVALVVMLVCTPYFGPTWRIQPPPKAPQVSYAQPVMAPASTQKLSLRSVEW